MINEKEYLVYDVEIINLPQNISGGWNNSEDMGLSSAVVYDYAIDRYLFFLHEESREKLLKYLNGRKVVSFNEIKFDSKVLLENNRTLTSDGTTYIPEKPFAQKSPIKIGWHNYNILFEYIKARFGYKTIGEAEQRLGDRAIHDGSFGLDGLAEGTLHNCKSGHGARAPILYAEEKYDELLSYNLHDVYLTR